MVPSRCAAMSAAEKGEAVIPTEYWITYVIVPFIGGIMAASAVIVAKKPEAEKLIGVLSPYKGFIGVGMLGLGIWKAIDFLPDVSLILKFSKLWGISGIAIIFSLITVGFILGAGTIAGWIPGEGAAEKKGMEFQKKLLPYEATLGFVAVGASILMAVTFLTI